MMGVLVENNYLILDLSNDTSTTAGYYFTTADNEAYSKSFSKMSSYWRVLASLAAFCGIPLIKVSDVGQEWILLLDRVALATNDPFIKPSFGVFSVETTWTSLVVGFARF